MSTGSSQYISVRETAQLLGVSEKKVMDLIQERKLQAYRIADQFLRLKKSEVVNIHSTGSVAREITPVAYTSQEKLRDFFYFNDFYIFCCLLILALLFYIFFLN